MLITYQLKSNELTLTSFIKSFKDKISLMVNLGVLIGLIIFIYIPFFNKIANTIALDFKYLLYIIILALVAVLPFDIIKIKNNHKIK